MPKDQYIRRIEKTQSYIGAGLIFALLMAGIALVIASISFSRPTAVTLCNTTCVNGTNGIDGVNGTNGIDGVNGTNGAAGAAGSLLDFADFFSLMPSNNAATVATGADVEFAQVGPAKTSTGITAVDSKSFQIAAVGIYDVSFFVSVAEAGQLEITLNGVVVANTVTGRATGTSYIAASYLLTVATVNTVLTVRNPAGNSAALTITPIAGGTVAVSAHLKILRLT